VTCIRRCKGPHPRARVLDFGLARATVGAGLAPARDGRPQGVPQQDTPARWRQGPTCRRSRFLARKEIGKAMLGPLRPIRETDSCD
jgi:hypothetical protein